jgi:hypothetical protein
MKRADITDLFPDAPKEAVDKLLAINGADIGKVRDELESLKQKYASVPDPAELEQAKQQIEQLNQELTGMKNAETVRLTREKVAGEKKIPAHLLTGDTEEACAKQADEILAFAKPGGYPQVRDGGEPRHSQTLSTRDKFANWANENL